MSATTSNHFHCEPSSYDFIPSILIARLFHIAHENIQDIFYPASISMNKRRLIPSPLKSPRKGTVYIWYIRLQVQKVFEEDLHKIFKESTVSLLQCLSVETGFYQVTQIGFKLTILFFNPAGQWRL